MTHASKILHDSSIHVSLSYNVRQEETLLANGRPFLHDASLHGITASLLRSARK